jgi:hypothetical protein
MRNKHIGAVMLLSALCVFDSGAILAQKNDPNNFLRSLSFEWNGSRIYGLYHGYSTAARIGYAPVKAPMLNRLFSSSPDASGDVLILPGLSVGTVGVVEGPFFMAQQILSPELSIHYPLAKIFQCGIYAGPSMEFIFTNNSKEFLLIPSAGLDLGLMYNITANFGVGIENRWVLSTTSDSTINKANFPRQRFSYIGITLRFSLPWQSETAAYEQARAECDKRIAPYVETERDVRNQKTDLDSLAAENKTLKHTLKDMAVKNAADSVRYINAIDAYDPARRVADPEYVFTKDPFKAGMLVNDSYLKDVLIDIIDDEYVWQLSAGTGRLDDAEKIKHFFSAYNTNLSRRISIRLEKGVQTFKLSCLGKIIGTDTSMKRN